MDYKWYHIKVVKCHPETIDQIEEYHEILEELEEFFQNHGGYDRDEYKSEAKACFDDGGYEVLITKREMQELIDLGLQVEFLPEKQYSWAKEYVREKMEEIIDLLHQSTVGFEAEAPDEEDQKIPKRPWNTGQAPTKDFGPDGISVGVPYKQ
jgi:hypothetical protein